MSESEAHSESTSDYHTIDEEQAKKIKESGSVPGQLDDLEEKMKSLGNVTRLKILSYLSQDDLCVHDLTTMLNISQSAVSHQLKKLKNQEILKRKKEGRVVYYSLNEPVLRDLVKKIESVLKS